MDQKTFAKFKRINLKSMDDAVDVDCRDQRDECSVYIFEETDYEGTYDFMNYLH